MKTHLFINAAISSTGRVFKTVYRNKLSCSRRKKKKKKKKRRKKEKKAVQGERERKKKKKKKKSSSPNRWHCLLFSFSSSHCR